MSIMKKTLVTNLQEKFEHKPEKQQSNLSAKIPINKKSISSLKKVPEIKQTLTSKYRLLKANPLLQYELEGKDISHLLNKNLPNLELDSTSMQTISTSSIKCNNGFKQYNTSKFNKSAPKNFIKENILNLQRQKFSTKTSIKPKSNDKNMQKPKSLIVKQKPVNKPANVRRSYSAEKFDKKKMFQQNSISSVQKMHSFEDLCQSNKIGKGSSLFKNRKKCSPIIEDKKNIVFKTPKAYQRRSVVFTTPSTVLSQRSQFLDRTAVVSNKSDLQKKLSDWLKKHGKTPNNFHHLRCFGIEKYINVEEKIINDENKENIAVEDHDSYEALKIPQSDDFSELKESKKHQETIPLNNDNIKTIAKQALVDLNKLIEENYPREQCETWLELIRNKCTDLEDEPQYWECRAAIEQSRGNIATAVECYHTAIVNGAKVQTVDESLDHLLEKFLLLNINTSEKCSPNNQKFSYHLQDNARVLKDARNAFKSSIIQFAVQERDMKKKSYQGCSSPIKYVVTPVRRSTRSSRTSFTSTPSIQLFDTIQELKSPVKNSFCFRSNVAL